MKSLSPADAAPPFARYAPGVEIPPGWRIVRTSGQLAQPEGMAVPEDAEAQAGLCFGQVAAILAAAGMGPGDVFHVTAYVTDRAHMPGYMSARDRFLAGRGADELPSSTLLIVSGFTRPEFKVEVEVWAAAP